MDIVVKSLDETLQLIQGHNHAIRWKVQGLACALNECVPPVQPCGGSQLIPPQFFKWTQNPKFPSLPVWLEHLVSFIGLILNPVK